MQGKRLKLIIIIFMFVLLGMGSDNVDAKTYNSRQFIAKLVKKLKLAQHPHLTQDVRSQLIAKIKDPHFVNDCHSIHDLIFKLNSEFAKIIPSHLILDLDEAKFFKSSQVLFSDAIVEEVDDFITAEEFNTEINSSYFFYKFERSFASDFIVYFKKDSPCLENFKKLVSDKKIDWKNSAWPNALCDIKQYGYNGSIFQKGKNNILSFLHSAKRDHLLVAGGSYYLITFWKDIKRKIGNGNDGEGYDNWTLRGTPFRPYSIELKKTQKGAPLLVIYHFDKKNGFNKLISDVKNNSFSFKDDLLVIDLRNAVGGYLTTMLKLLSLIYPEQQKSEFDLQYLSKWKTKKNDDHVIKGTVQLIPYKNAVGNAYDEQLLMDFFSHFKRYIILVKNKTVSAAEFFAWEMKIRFAENVVIMGEESRGCFEGILSTSVIDGVNLNYPCFLVHSKRKKEVLTGKTKIVPDLYAKDSDMDKY